MSPMLLDELSGLKVELLTTGATSTMLASTAGEVVAWGASPCYGELGFGDKGPKSSTKPDYVADLRGAAVLGLAMGVAHTLVLVDTGAAASKAVFDKLPLLVVPQPPAAAAGAKKRKDDDKPAAAAAAASAAAPKKSKK